MNEWTEPTTTDQSPMEPVCRHCLGMRTTPNSMICGGCGRCHGCGHSPTCLGEKT